MPLYWWPSDRQSRSTRDARRTHDIAALFENQIPRDASTVLALMRLTSRVALECALQCTTAPPAIPGNPGSEDGGMPAAIAVPIQ